MKTLLKRIALIGIATFISFSAWGQGNPRAKKKSSFRAPIFYVRLANDSTKTPVLEADSVETSAVSKVTSVKPIIEPTETAAISPKKRLEQPVKVETYPSRHDSVSFALQHAKLDSLTQKLATIQVQLASLQNASASASAPDPDPAKIQQDSLPIMDSVGVKTTSVITKEAVTAMSTPDYSVNFQQLSQQIGMLQGQLQAMDNKQPETPPSTQTPMPIQAQQIDKTEPEKTAVPKEVVADPKLKEAVEAQNKQVAELQHKLESYALNNARGIDDLQKANRDLSKQIEDLILLQGPSKGSSKKTVVAPIIVPRNQEIVIPKDTALSRQLADIQRQLASRQDTTVAQPDSMLIEQFTQLNSRLASLQADQQTQLLSINQLSQSNDSLQSDQQSQLLTIKQLEQNNAVLQAQLVAAKGQKPVKPVIQVQRDTLVQIQVKTQLDTVRLKTEILGLQKTNIYFQKGSSNLFDADLPVLARLAQQLLAHPDLTLYLRGFADNLSGSAALNLRLSEARAEQLKTFFVTRGVDEARLVVEAFGSQSPMYKNALDRRVELEVMSKK